MNHGVIMAGGKGERFWPLSRAQRPKQFLKLTSDKTMLEETIDRVTPLIPLKNIRIVAGESMTEHILKSIPNIERSNILTEPFGTKYLLSRSDSRRSILLHEDPRRGHGGAVGRPPHSPRRKTGADPSDGTAIASKEERLITIGITPTRPETAYGYIKLGELYRKEGETNVYSVSQFAEKPKATVAQEYYYSRQYLWNSGMFIWSAKAILDALASCQLDMYKHLVEYGKAIGTPREDSTRKALYDSSSVDLHRLRGAGEGEQCAGDEGGYRLG